MLDNRKKLQLSLAKRGYMNEDLVNEIEQIYSKQQLPIHGVVGSKITDEQKIKLANETFKTINELFDFKK